MVRKPKYSKETKVKACRGYKDGIGSFESIAKSIGADLSSVRLWYFTYEIHGESAFEHSCTNKSYTSEFKRFVIDEYLSGKYTFIFLSAKYLISTRVLRDWVKKSYNGIELKNYDPKGEVYTMKSRKTTYEERLEIVKCVVANEMNYKDAADKYGIKYALIYQWVHKYLKNGSEALKYKNRGPKSKKAIDESDLDDVQRLKLELERERSIRERAEFRLEVLKKKRSSRRN